MITRLALTVTVIAVGAVVFRPLQFASTTATYETALIAGAAWDVAALAVATGLGVFQPGRSLRRREHAAKDGA